MASLPVSGIDGTLTRSRHRPAAHLKTGSLRRPGWRTVLASSGRRYVVVAIVNHPNANAARRRSTLVQWVVQDAILTAPGGNSGRSANDERPPPRHRLGRLRRRDADHAVLRAAGWQPIFQTRATSGISLGMYSAFTLGVLLGWSTACCWARGPVIIIT